MQPRLGTGAGAAGHSASARPFGRVRMKPMGVLRPLSHDELDAVVAVERDSAVVGLSHIFPQEDHPFPTEAARTKWHAAIDDDAIRSLAIDEGSGLDGYVTLRGAELMYFGTAVRTWGTGLAGRAHEEMVDELRSAGHARAWLRCLEDHHRAVRFYTRHGWAPTDETSPSPYAPWPTLRTFTLDLG